jgi:hypothetical protein
VLVPQLEARADDPSPEDIAAARMLGVEGVKMAAAGDCKGAIPKLQSAEKLFHAPTTAEWLGECEINVGRVVAGTELLNSLIHEVLAPNAPPAFAAAQRKAQEVLPGALPKIARLKIHVDAPPGTKPAVTVDTDRVPNVLLDSDRPTDPGQHEVKAVAPGFLLATAPVTLTPGGSGSVTLKLEPDPNARAVPSATAEVPTAVPTTAATTGPSGGPPPPPPPVQPRNNMPAYISFGVGGVGLAVGAIFGAMALGTKGTLDSNCTNKICPSSQQSNVDSLNSQATISSVGFGVGVVGAGVGLVLLLAGGSSEPAPKPATGGVHVAPWVGANALGLGGTFE